MSGGIWWALRLGMSNLEISNQTSVGTRVLIFNVALNFPKLIIEINGSGSSVGVVTGYGLDGPWIESRWGARFSIPAQTGPGAHPASCTMGTRSFPGVKCGWSMLLTTHPLLAPRSWKSRDIPLPTLWATTGPVTGLLYFTLHFLPEFAMKPIQLLIIFLMI